MFLNKPYSGPPDPPRITNSAGAFIEGRSRSLECVALNGYPPGVIEWLLDGDPTSDTSNTVVKRWRYDVTSRVTINPDRSMNGKEVKCTVRSPSVSTTEMQSAIVLDVQCEYKLEFARTRRQDVDEYKVYKTAGGLGANVVTSS